jgi:peptidoglycan/xylan/chitin deacetylase (PgdA/CDA1 family)
MSVRLKRTVAGVFGPLRFFRAYGALKPRNGDELLLLGYHRILPLGDGIKHEGDIELISATPEEFAWQVDYIRRRFNPVSFEDIADCIDGKKQLPPRAIAITFDDGFADVYEYAFPILQQAGVPATVFVSTEYVSEHRPFWFDLVAWLIANAPTGTVFQSGNSQPVQASAMPSERASATVKILKWLKNCSETERHDAVSSLYAQLPDLTERGVELLGRALSWEQIQEMAAAGIEFGSHTVSHRCLAKLSQTELEFELRASKRHLDEHLNKPITALAYPFGGPTAYSDDVISTAQRFGYRVGTTYIPGVNSLSKADRFALRRQHVERDTSRDYFEAIINAPEWFD